MGVSIGPKIVTDGLVFYLDAGDRQSSIGNNLINGTGNPYLSVDEWTLSSGWGGSKGINTNENAIVLTSINGWYNMYCDTGVNDTTITLSFDAKWGQLQSSSAYLYILNGLNLGSYTQYITNTTSFNTTSYTTVSYTFAITSDSRVCIGSRNQDSQGFTDIIYLRNLKIEIGDTYTEWTPSPGDGGLRWTNLINYDDYSTLDSATIATETFNMMTFNGSSNLATLVADISLGNGNIEWTVNVWVKTNQNVSTALANGPILTNSASGPVYSNMAVQSGKATYWAYSGGWYSLQGTVTVNDNIWHMITWVQKSDYKMDIYVDGVIDVINQTSTTGNNNPINIIGKSWGTTYLSGSLSIIQIYKNGLLSPANILQNYNAQKSRFGK